MSRDARLERLLQRLCAQETALRRYNPTINASAVLVLYTIALAGAGGAVRMKDISSRTGLAPQTVSSIIRSLCRRGRGKGVCLVRTYRQGEGRGDQRANFAALTKRGEALIAEIFQIFTAE